MHIIEGLDRGVPHGGTVTIGNFDGVHRGHQRILETVTARARERHGAAVALTFQPHPAKVLYPTRPCPLITPPARKYELMEACGVDTIVVLPFTSSFAALSPRAFAAEVLRERLRSALVVVGFSFTFGRNREGDVRLLTTLGAELGFPVEGIPPVLVGDVRVSSSAVRRAVSEGDVAAARRLLGRPFDLAGTVVEGARLGRTLGIPTANIESTQELLPKRGVYVCHAEVKGERLQGVTNIGIRPTVGGEKLTIETHLLDFDGDLYGASVRLAFLARVRDEKKFPGLDALRAQIADDIARARVVLAAEEGPDVGVPP